MNLITGKININSLLAFLFGIIFLTTMLAFAVFFPNPEPFQIRVFITSLALAAAGIGAMLPGTISVTVSGWIRAGGALALFALVYLFQPTLEQQVPRLITPAQNAEPVALAFMKALDQGHPQNAWNLMDKVSQERVEGGLRQFIQLYETVRRPAGVLSERDLVHTTTLENPPGLPIGVYRTMSFRSKTIRPAECRIETVTLRGTSSLSWAVDGYYISGAVPCT